MNIVGKVSIRSLIVTGARKSWPSAPESELGFVKYVSTQLAIG
jgi:hypothetical protein